MLKREAVDEREAFLVAIRAAPEDDTPRLAFADWLQEHGDEPQTEFIRVQVKLARLADGDLGSRIYENGSRSCFPSSVKRGWGIGSPVRIAHYFPDSQ